MKKYYLIQNKPDDFGNNIMGVIYEELKAFKKYVYEYQEIPKSDYEILKKYLFDCEEWEDFGYSSLKNCLDEYFA